jgi:hypothetical protein
VKRALAAGITLAAVACAPTAHADATCTFDAPVIIFSLTAPVVLICGDGNNTTINHSTQIDPSLFGRGPTVP